jgi:hypothetical protein
MEDQDQAAEAAPEQNAVRARREALRTLTKAAYVAPAVIATLAATKARAAS